MKKEETWYVRPPQMNLILNRQLTHCSSIPGGNEQEVKSGRKVIYGHVVIVGGHLFIQNKFSIDIVSLYVLYGRM